MTTRTSPRIGSTVARAAALSVLALVLLGTLGCEEPIFKPNEPRSQYDRMDMVRNTREPSLIPDEMGTLHPNLAGRLSGVR